MRHAMAEVMVHFFDRDEAMARRKTRYALGDPALRPALLESTDELVRRVAEGLRRSSALDELEAEVTAASMMWAMLAAARDWHRSGYANPIREEVERALHMVERGLS